MTTSTLSEVTAVRGAGEARASVAVRDHRLTTGSKSDDAGARPGELIAVALAACKASGIANQAASEGWDVGDIRVTVRYDDQRPAAERAYDATIGFSVPVTDEQWAVLAERSERSTVQQLLANPLTVTTTRAVSG